ncbi:InlB B-repeat-containing protein [Streptomyces sp. NRRL S-118]|uniref:InlB B-repeat-containing protein n=1 Tax=Streptomyces sp. NRRL S-118 TaxID=1463881 RepID=UPI0004C7C6D9|nr:PKD domain-containing protein [Streptomyces sp. NRRL S-118]
MARVGLAAGVRSLLGGRWAAGIVWTVIGAVGVGTVAVMSADDGYTAERPRLLSGAAWLPSSKAGQLALLDGSTAEVAAQVKVATGGGELEVVQHGADAYAVDAVRGSVRRVDGATLKVTPSLSGGALGARPVPGAAEGLRVFAGDDVLYAVDTARGVLAEADPATLARRGDLQPLASDAPREATLLDPDGALWALDVKAGDLNIVRGGERETRRGVKKPGPGLLVLAGGSPVLVDVAGRSASLLDRHADEPVRTVPLELRGGDEVVVSGSPSAPRIYVVSRGVLTVCELAASGCGRAVTLGRSGAGFGAAVESGGRLFVPDFVAGAVWIVDLAASRVVAQPRVLDPPSPFQLLSRDGVVFFNDPASERAGIIRLDGDVLKVPKYDPDNQDKGLTRQPRDDRPAGTPPSPRPPDTPSSPDPSAPPSQDATAPPGGAPPPQATGAPNPAPPPTAPPHSPPAPPPGSQPTTLPRPTPPASPGRPNSPPPPVTSPPSTPPQTGSPTVSITLSKQTADVGEQVALQVSSPAGSPAPTTADWNFGDGMTGTGLVTSHPWGTAGTFQINVTATFADGRKAVAGASIDITERPVLTVQTPAGGKVTGGPVSCPPTCSYTADAGETITLTAEPAPGFRMGGWGGDCAGTTPTCAVTMNANKTVTVRFSRDSTPLIPLAPSAAWRTGAGPIPWSGTSDHNGGVDEHTRGFALLRPAGSFLLEDNTSPEYLETHPQWVDNGWIEGDFTLPVPVVPGDRFKARIGFMAVAEPPSAGEADFVVSAVFANGSTVELSRTHDVGRDGVMYQLDVDLAAAVGATGIRLRAEATGSSAQDWCSWVNPRIEG